MWIGSTAYSGWTADNANIEVSYIVSGNGPGQGSYTIYLLAGTYYPFRIMFAQAQGYGSLTVTAASPNGTIFLSSSTRLSPYLVEHSCDNVTAPSFPYYGLET